METKIGIGLADRLRSLCAHDRASTLALLEAMRTIDDVPQEVLDKMAHIVAAQHLWMNRFGLLPDPPPDLFPTGQDLDTIAQRAAEIGAHWQGYVDALDDEACSRVVTYTATEGTRHRNLLVDILLHLSTHGQYHRGQVSRLLRDVLPEPVVTDYMLFVREDVDQ